MDNTNKLKLAEQVLAAHKAKLATTANKDQVRRAIKTTETRIQLIEADVEYGG